MIRLRHYLLLLSALVLLASCSKERPEEPIYVRPEVAPQTLLIYFSGRGNLASPFDRNVDNMVKALNKGILGYSRILLFRQTGMNTSSISEFVYNPQTKRGAMRVIQKYNEPLTSTDGPTMTRILNDMIALAPAEKYGLILGSHATGWVPSSSLSAAPGIRRLSDDYWKKSEGEPLTRGFGMDNLVMMDIPVLAKSLEATGHKYEYLIFDACFMSSMEAIYDLRRVTDHVIASPCEVMLYGHPYDDSLPFLFTDGGTEYDLQKYCESFYNFYSATTLTRQSGCIALANCSEFDALADVVRRIHAAGLKKYDPETLQTYEGLSPHLFYDLKQFVEVSCSDDALLAEFRTRFDHAFPPASRLHTPEFYTDYGRIMLPITYYSGVTVSEPSSKYTAENKLTNWYIDTHR